MKKIFLALMVCGSALLNAIDLGSLGGNLGNIAGGVGGNVLNNALSNLDSKFDGVFKKSLNFANVCFNQNFRLGVDTNDPCAMANELDKLGANVCKAFGGNYNISAGGFRALCNAKLREFSNYSSELFADSAEWAIINADEKTTSLPKLQNGLTFVEQNKYWDVNNVLQNKDNLPATMLKNGRIKEYNLLKKYAEKKGLKPEQINLQNIQIVEDIVPKNNEKYQEGIKDYVVEMRKMKNNATPTTTGTYAKDQISNKKDTGQIWEEVRHNYDKAKELEIGSAMKRVDKRIATPTADYVNKLRHDLKLKAMTEIREQQGEEARIVSEIDEKWEKKKVLAKLLIDKEAIMAEKFDEKSAREEVNKIAN